MTEAQRGEVACLGSLSWKAVEFGSWKLGWPPWGLPESNKVPCLPPGKCKVFELLGLLCPQGTKIQHEQMSVDSR